jgi:hypothetical protein
MSNFIDIFTDKFNKHFIIDVIVDYNTMSPKIHFKSKTTSELHIFSISGIDMEFYKRSSKKPKSIIDMENKLYYIMRNERIEELGI